MIAAALALAAGCSNQGQPAESASSEAQPSTEWEEIAAPALAYADFQLPPSCLVEDLDGGYAVYQQNLHQQYPEQCFGLMDLSTGEYFTVLGEPVNAEGSYFMCSPRLGGGWIAWEEVSPNESIEPDKADWRLYAARVDFANRRIETPVLVDSGNTALYARPFYGFRGDSLIWSRNLTSMNQEARQPHSELLSRVPSAADEVVLFESGRNWRAVCVEGDVVTVTEAPDSSEDAERVIVIDATSGATLGECTLPDGAQSAHFARYAEDGTILYGAFPGQNVQWPNLYAVNGGEQSVVRARSMDAVRLGKYHLFERVVESGPRGLTSQLWGLSAESCTVFMLDERTEGLWQTPMCASTDDAGGVLAVTLDLAPYVADQSMARTMIRVYRAP